MYAVSSPYRVYISFFLFLCVAFLSAPTLANDGYWSTNERRFVSQQEVNRNVQRILDSSVRKPTGSTLGASPTAPTVTKNSAGGLSATTQNTIKTLGQPSAFNSTLNNSVSSAKTALKSCVRSPACAGRALGGGTIIFEGIKAWQNVYEFYVDDNGVIHTLGVAQTLPFIPPEDRTPSYFDDFGRGINLSKKSYSSCPSTFEGIYKNMTCSETSSYYNGHYCRTDLETGGYHLVGYLSISDVSGTCQYQRSQPPLMERPLIPVSLLDLDNSIDESYQPSVSDAPIVLLSGEPESITLSTPSSADLPATTTTSTDSLGQMTTAVTNNMITYNVTNNNTSSPSINSSVIENTTVYDSTSNIIGTSTSTTTESGVQPDVLPSAPPIEFELPSFCSWATIVCDWIGWTQEPLDYDEPDLTVLISEFEPDEYEFNLGIGDGVCPAPIQLNITFIGKTVEVSYEPFCEFVSMIRPFILAAAYLFAAYLYIGVLKRG
ncbi:MAG: 50-kDa virion protein [Inoviridae sp.]|nr:MAG: 50-kDa virion protein [Inoviridae sp.]